MSTTPPAAAPQSWQDTVAQALKESTVTQAILAISLIWVYCFCLVNKIDVPREFFAVMGVIIGHFFRAKSDVRANQITRQSNRALETAAD